MNFVKTKVELSRMHIGDVLRILLDDGEPIDNVPRSVKTEGHAIVSQERQEDHWQVVIEKKA
jgi:sulfite reductase (ferredoxin)